MIKFDLDGVLVDLISVFEGIIKEKGFRIIPNESFRWHTEPEMTDDLMWDYFKMSYGVWRRTKPFPGAQELLRYIWEMTGKPIQIITSRPSNWTTETYRMVETLFDVPFFLAMVDTSEKKWMYLEPGDIMVEDRRKTVLDLARRGIHSILIDREYNQIPAEAEKPYITRVSGIDEILPMLPFLGAK